MKRKLLKKLGVGLLITATVLALFVVAFVFNPMEGGLRDMRDVVPRQVDFFVRKLDLAGDFKQFPEPVFWKAFTDSTAWRDLEGGPLVQGLKRDGVEVSLQQVADLVQQVRTDSSGWLDVMRDVIGSELIVAGYFEDIAGKRPLPEPQWCVYARVSWRVRAAWGLLRYGLVQSQVRKGGIDIQSEGDMLVLKPSGGRQTFYVARKLDCLMLANDKHIVEQSLALAEGSRDEEPFGQMARYTDSVVSPLRSWAKTTGSDDINALEFSVSPNTLDGFKQFAARWPSPGNQDSIYERVMASFLNLKGWNSISGALMFDDERLSFLGEVVLNSKMHTPFQADFFKTEAQARDKWLDTFLRMVPDNSCAAAALRMPAGGFMEAMFQALAPKDREDFNNSVRRSSWEGQQLADVRDLIDRLKVALLPRTGFVFRKNLPDKDIPVANPAPVPQVAWVFWVGPGGAPILQQLMKWARSNAPTLRFAKVYLLKLNFSGTSSAVNEDTGAGDVVCEFTNPQIDGTGEIATILFKDFFVISNSGPLIRDMFWARYGVNGRKSIVENEDWLEFQRELPNALNGLAYLRGPQLAELFSEFKQYDERMGQDPDPGWMQSMRPDAEDKVRRARFQRYASVAAIPESQRDEFEREVQKWLLQQWKTAGSGLNAADLAKLAQLQAFAESFRGAYVRVDLESNYIRFLGKILAEFR